MIGRGSWRRRRGWCYPVLLYQWHTAGSQIWEPSNRPPDHIEIDHRWFEYDGLVYQAAIWSPEATPSGRIGIGWVVQIVHSWLEMDFCGHFQGYFVEGLAVWQSSREPESLVMTTYYCCCRCCCPRLRSRGSVSSHYPLIRSSSFALNSV